ncbi:hypothetical protein B0H34DRAFT_801818 [Crassisporium funariophilum]|nr:hypothetical protein B0H34DRAFT_801818 [Crassisporium funariophilum]
MPNHPVVPHLDLSRAHLAMNAFPVGASSNESERSSILFPDLDNRRGSDTSASSEGSDSYVDVSSLLSPRSLAADATDQWRQEPGKVRGLISSLIRRSKHKSTTSGKALATEVQPLKTRGLKVVPTAAYNVLRKKHKSTPDLQIPSLSATNQKEIDTYYAPAPLIRANLSCNDGYPPRVLHTSFDGGLMFTVDNTWNNSSESLLVRHSHELEVAAREPKVPVDVDAGDIDYCYMIPDRRQLAHNQATVPRNPGRTRSIRGDSKNHKQIWQDKWFKKSGNNPTASFLNFKG